MFYGPIREDGNADNGIQGFGGSFSAPSNFLGNGVAFRLGNGFNTRVQALGIPLPYASYPTSRQLQQLLRPVAKPDCPYCRSHLNHPLRA